MATAKELDALKTKVEQKQADIAALNHELLELQKELGTKAKEFFVEAGIELPSATTPKAKPKAKAKEDSSGAINQVVVKELKSLLGKKKFISIAKTNIQELADHAGCTVADVEATMSELLTSYNPEKKRGRNIRFAFK